MTKPIKDHDLIKSLNMGTKMTVFSIVILPWFVCSILYVFGNFGNQVPMIVHLILGPPSFFIIPIGSVVSTYYVVRLAPEIGYYMFEKPKKKILITCRYNSDRRIDALSFIILSFVMTYFILYFSSISSPPSAFSQIPLLGSLFTPFFDMNVQLNPSQQYVLTMIILYTIGPSIVLILRQANYILEKHGRLAGVGHRPLLGFIYTASFTAVLNQTLHITTQNQHVSNLPIALLFASASLGLLYIIIMYVVDMKLRSIIN